jgi:hypothetical protein
MTRRRWGLLVLSATLAFWSLGGEWVSIHQHVPENHFLDLLGRTVIYLRGAHVHQERMRQVSSGHKGLTLEGS